MRVMVIETFRDGDPKPVYKRFAGRGRLLPEGVTYRVLGGRRRRTLLPAHGVRQRRAVAALDRRLDRPRRL